MATAGELTTVLLFAVLVEMLVEYFVKPLIPIPQGMQGEQGAPLPRWQTLPYARYAAAVAGVGLCLVYGLDVVAALIPAQPDGGSSFVPYAGMILTGLLISRGANYVHDWLADPLFARPGPAHRDE